MKNYFEFYLNQGEHHNFLPLITEQNQMDGLADLQFDGTPVCINGVAAVFGIEAEAKTPQERWDLAEQVATVINNTKEADDFIDQLPDATDDMKESIKTAMIIHTQRDLMIPGTDFEQIIAQSIQELKLDPNALYPNDMKTLNNTLAERLGIPVTEVRQYCNIYGIFPTKTKD